MVELIDETQRYPRPDALASALEALMRHLGLEDRELTLVLVDDARIQELNLADREVDAPTDVLSYPLNEPDDVGMPQVPHLGDIIISVDTAARQALAAGHSPEEEAKVLAAHGLMHLLGYDHQTEAAWQDFTNAQSLILTLS